MITPATIEKRNDQAGYMARVKTLSTLFSDLLIHFTATGVYTEDPIGEAFVHLHHEPGRSWNMEAWNAARRQS